ncbi:MAG: glycerate kinase [Clostridiaceae bacterium]
MKIIIAPDSFKGSLSAKEVADNVEIGIRRVLEKVEIVKVPMADGGEGTVQSLVDSTNGRIIELIVTGPIFKKVNSFYGILGDGKTAIIEMASASGLPLLNDEEKNPMNTTTYGTGELIKDALDKGCRKIIIGIGGSATNDGGVGMLAALGIQFLDENSKEIKPIGGELNKISSINMDKVDKRINECEFISACDVDNPLVGKNGASYIFAPQKGATEAQVKTLDANLNHYADIIEKTLNISVANYKGAGAAGGLGAGILAFLNGNMQKGIDIVIQTTNLEEKIKDADLIITGEGMIDYQTQFGKTPYGVCLLGKRYNIPVIAIAGGLGKKYRELYDLGFKSIFSIVDKPMKLEDSIKNSDRLIQDVSERIMRIII